MTLHSGFPPQDYINNLFFSHLNSHFSLALLWKLSTLPIWVWNAFFYSTYQNPRKQIHLSLLFDPWGLHIHNNINNMLYSFSHYIPNNQNHQTKKEQIFLVYHLLFWKLMYLYLTRSLNQICSSYIISYILFVTIFGISVESFGRSFKSTLFIRARCLWSCIKLEGIDWLAIGVCRVTLELETEGIDWLVIDVWKYHSPLSLVLGLGLLIRKLLSLTYKNIEISPNQKITSLKT